MKKRSSLLGVLIALLGAQAALPDSSHANDMRISSYEMSETGGIVLLESTVPIGEPWMRVDSQGVRIWFPDVSDVARFDHARDTSDPVRGLQLRPGAENSAVLRLELGAGRKLSRDHVEIVRTGNAARVTVRFPENARPLPPLMAAKKAALAAPPAAAPAAAPANAPEKPQQTLGAQAPVAQVAPILPQAAAPSKAPPPAADGVRETAAVSGGSGAVRTLAESARAPEAAALGLADGPGTNIGALVLFSIVLGGAYLAIRRYAKQKSERPQDIQVLSARRLGHRSELLVVRALGADHLLVTSSGRVERVASVPTPAEPMLAAAAAPEPTPTAAPAMQSVAEAAEAASQANGLGIISKLSSSYRVRKLLDAVDQETAEPAPARPSGRPAFGPELLSAMNQHKFGSLASLPPLALKQSDAVAGITRLRRNAN